MAKLLQKAIARKPGKYRLDGKKLRTLRGKFTTSEVSVATGIDQSNYSAFENDASIMPSINTLAVLADCFGVGIFDLLAETGADTGVTLLYDLAPKMRRPMFTKDPKSRRVITISENNRLTRFIEIPCEDDGDILTTRRGGVRK